MSAKVSSVLPKRGPERIILLQTVSFFAMGALMPFHSLYFKELLVRENGQTAYFIVGLLFFLQAGAGMLGTPIAGYFADRFKIKNRILFICALMVTGGAVFMLLPGLPASGAWSFDAKVYCLLAAMVLNGLFFRPIPPLTDTATLEFLHERDGNGDRYGRIRLYGSVSWAVSVCLFGWLLHATGRFDYIVVGYGIGFLLFALVAFSGVKAKVKPVRIPWEHLLRDRVFRVFLIFSFLLGIAINSSFNFTSYLMEDARATYWEIGLAFGLAALPEVPIMLQAGRIKRFLGVKGMLLVGSSLMLIKLILLVAVAATKNTWIFILIHCLHGLGYSVFFLGGIYLMDKQAHEDLRAMYQNLFQLIWSAAMAVGGLTAGFIIQRFGNTSLMFADSLIAAFSILYLLFALGRREKEVPGIVE